MTYYSFIDGLRGLAILFVIIFHFFPSLLPGGFIGVDVFFVISGFLITSIIWEKMQSGTFSFADFYAARIRRLLPAAIVMYGAVTVLSFFILMPDTFKDFGRSLTKAITFVSNHYFFNTTGYFPAPAHDKPLLHTWSLSVEEQFYIIWPLLLFCLYYFIPKHYKRLTFISCAVIFIGSLIAAEMIVHIKAERAFYMLYTRAWELMFGAVLALFAHKISLSRGQAEGASFVGFVLVICSALYLSEKSIFPGLSAVPVCLGTALMILSGIKHQTSISRLFSFTPILFLGLISYSLYLWHWPILSLARNLQERPLTSQDLILLLIISVIISVISWKYIEQPFRHKDRRFYFNTFPAIRNAGIMIVAFFAIGKTIQLTYGMPWRLDPNIRAVYDNMLQQNVLRNRCDGYENVFKYDEFCNFGVKKNASASFDMAILGDSKASQYVDLYREYALKNNISGRQVTNSACGPLLEITAEWYNPKREHECLNLQKEIVKFVEANPNLKLVVLASHWERYQRDDEMSYQSIGISNELHESLLNEKIKKGTYAYHLRLTIEFFLKKGIRVHVMGDIPDYKHVDGLPLKCIKQAIKNGLTPNCGMPVKFIDTQTKLEEVFVEIARRNPEVTYYLPNKLICNQINCDLFLESEFIYRDDGHLNAVGSRLLYKYATFPVVRK